VAQQVTEQHVVEVRLRPGDDRVEVVTWVAGGRVERFSTGDAPHSLVSVAGLVQPGDNFDEELGRRDHNVDVKDGLSCQARNRRAADVLNLYWQAHQDATQLTGQGFEPCRP
jgi:hypothetical protein